MSYFVELIMTQVLDTFFNIKVFHSNKYFLLDFKNGTCDQSHHSERVSIRYMYVQHTWRHIESLHIIGQTIVTIVTPCWTCFPPEIIIS